MYADLTKITSCFVTDELGIEYTPVQLKPAVLTTPLYSNRHHSFNNESLGNLYIF